MNNNEELEEMKRLARRHWYLKKKQDPVWWAKKQEQNRKGNLKRTEKAKKRLLDIALNLPLSTDWGTSVFQRPQFKERIIKPLDVSDGKEYFTISLFSDFEKYAQNRCHKSESDITICHTGNVIINKKAIGKYDLHHFSTCNFYFKDKDTIGILFARENRGSQRISWSYPIVPGNQFYISRKFIEEKQLKGKFKIIDTDKLSNGDLEVLLNRIQEKDNGNN